MENKKFGVLLIFLLFFSTIFGNLVLAELEVNATAISLLTIPEINKPAIFSLSIQNLDFADDFTIYALSGIRIEAEDVSIGKGKTAEVIIKAYPTIPLKISPDYYSFEYKIKGEDTPAQEEQIAVSMVKLADAFDISAEDITPDSNTATIKIKNKYGGEIENITLKLSSELFEQTSVFSLKANEEKEIAISLDKNKTAALLAGPYIVRANINVDSVEASKDTIIDFNEKEGITTSEISEGVMLRRTEIEKTNEGNTKATVSIAVEKNFFSALFTSYNVPANKKSLSGLSIQSTFTRELSPGESLKVVSKTNWWILVLILAAIGVIYYLVDRYVKNKVVLSKKVSFVRTKGGEFALKVSIHVKARDFVERIRILDRLPPMVKVFERYGMEMPEKIDEKNRRLEWNIQALERGEIRELSYIIYSKIGVVGRFELPAAEAFYEYMGKIKEASSNPVVYEAK